jgi:predicted dehydrogenase
MAGKLRWGVLGVAGIAVKKVIPAMQKCELAEISAIASRDPAKAAQAAGSLGIAKHYGSYEALLADPEIDVVYNPLPNHLHVPWSIRALQAGKHVLCEKPLGLSAAEVRSLIEARDRSGCKAGEAFMVATHPQWLRAREIVRSGLIGDLRAVTGWFSYDNHDPQNVRNMASYGGGGLMDIGCYPIFVSRFLFGAEPRRVAGTLELDPVFRTDRLASAVLDFPAGQATFICSTQLVPGQRILALGTKGSVEIEIPFNAPPDRPCRLWVDDGSSLSGESRREESFPVCDQYTLQGDAFSRAVLGQGPVPVPLEDSLCTMAVIQAVVRSASGGGWEIPG